MKKSINKKIIYRLFLLLTLATYFYPIMTYSIENIDNNNIEDKEISEKEEKTIDSIQTDNNNSENNIPSTENNTTDTTIQTDNIINENQESIETPSVLYSTHIENLGWRQYVKDGEMAGTSGRSLRLEGIKIKLENQHYNGDIEYKTHIQNLGWEQEYKKQDQLSGTSGRAFRLEAIQIRLNGELADHYDIYYRVHAENFGWLGWAKNDEEAGTAGYGFRLEAIEIKIVKKDMPIKDYGSKKAYHKKDIMYSTHVENLGWQNYVYDGQMSGTSGRSFRLEGIKLKLNSPKYSGDIEYRTYIQNIGWQNYVKNDAISGTSGKSLRLEAIQIRLTGEMANHYDIYYRVHAENFGWLDWAKDGVKAGTIGYNYRLEAIEVKLVEKDTSAPGSTTKPFTKKLIKYKSYQNKNWQNYVYDGGASGNTSKSLDAYSINLIKDDISGNIVYSSYTNGNGWGNYVSNGATSNEADKRIEAVKIKLEGDIANYYDVYYSVYISSLGWLDWAKNDQASGNIGYDKTIQSIRIKLVEKNNPAPGNTTNIYSEEEMKIKYNTYVVGNSWQGYKENGATSGTTGQSKSLQAIKIKLNKKTISGTVAYSTQVATIGWTNFVEDDNQSGIIGKNIEAVKIKLTGELEQRYDIYYRLHVSNVGWMGWASNGNPAGTAQGGLGAEALEIKLVEKGNPAPENTSDMTTTQAFLSARWETDAAGHKYFYDVFGNMVKGRSYKIGNITHHFGPSGLYLGTQNLEILDISAHNGNVDWQSVASSGVYGVIIRVAASAEYRDSKLKENIAGCKRYGIPYGIYIYSYAENFTEGQAYANFTRALMREFDMSPTLGIFLDLESNNITRFMGPTEYTAVVKGFYSVIPEAEVYTYTSYANSALNTSYIRDRITWIADYRGYVGYMGKYRMWQYTSTGTNSGVTGDVDRNVLYSFG